MRTNDISGHPPEAPPFGDSRAELRRTLRMHELGTTATLAVSWGISIIFSIGIAAGLYETLKSHDTGDAPGVTVLAMVALCVMAWVPCCHYLWRCYRSGLRDVRKLHRQINRLERFDAEFKRVSRAPRKRLPRNAVSLSARGKQPEQKLHAPQQAAATAEQGSVGKVVLFDSYRR